MIYPRFVARFFAWLLGYFWLPCPVCKQPFAGFEAAIGSGVIVDEPDGPHAYCTCLKPSCMAEGERQRMDYMQRRWATMIDSQSAALDAARKEKS